MKEQKLTAQQLTIVRQYGEIHGLRAEQISFEDDRSLEPIFDHNAVSTLSLRLTDIQDISPTNLVCENKFVTVLGSITLPDGRTRGAIGSCSIGERIGNGEVIETQTAAIGVATSRCFRQAIRNVGVNLHAAHNLFVETGEIAVSHTNVNPRNGNYAELHMLAAELDLIVDGNKKKYRKYLAENFDGRGSAKELNDLELQKLLSGFRSLARLRRDKVAA